MKLDAVTSLADLAFKAKTNKYYQQLTIIVYRYLISGTPPLGGWSEALESLNNYSIHCSPNDCKEVVQYTNDLRIRVKEEKPPAPVVAPTAPATVPAGGFSPAVDEASQKFQNIVAELKKKKKANTKKKLTSTRSSTASTRRSNVRGRGSNTTSLIVGMQGT